MLHAVADDDLEPEPGPPTADHADEVAGTHDAASALASIPEEFRIALVLADVQDMAYDQIAQVLEVPIGTVKSRVHRGRLALAAALGIEPAPGNRSTVRRRRSGTVTHPLDQLAAFVDGTLATAERAVVDEHLRSCARCRGEVEAPPGPGERRCGRCRRR